MNSRVAQLVAEILALQVIVLPVMVLMVLLMGRRFDRERREHAVAVDKLYEALAAAIMLSREKDQRETVTQVVDRLSDVDPEVSLDALHLLVTEFNGRDRDLLRAVAYSAGLLARAHHRARSVRWRRREDAARLVALHPNRLSIHRDLILDRHVEVQMMAIESVTDDSLPTVVPALIQRLSSGRRAVRIAAQHALIRLGPMSVEPLTGHLADVSGDAAVWALDVAFGLHDPGLVDAIVAHASDDDVTTRVTVARCLGAHGGDVAMDALAVLLSDESAEVRAGAAESFGRLNWVEVAGRLGDLLEDPAWLVRRRAGEALARLGPTGEAVLRSSLRSEDPFAADMAHQVLDHIELGLIGSRSGRAAFVGAA